MTQEQDAPASPVLSNAECKAQYDLAEAAHRDARRALRLARRHEKHCDIMSSRASKAWVDAPNSTHPAAARLAELRAFIPT